MRIEYIDHMGSDLTVVNAARVSFDKFHDVFDGSDEKLVKYLATHNHISPFFHPQIQVRVTVPFFIANQLKRHQVGLALNEVSRRYVDSEPEFYITDKLGARAENKKQGSKEGEFIEKLSVRDPETDIHRLMGKVDSILKQKYEMDVLYYNLLLDNGVAPEDARMVLPLATYTSWIWTGSLHSYFRMYNLRVQKDAQRQTQEIAGMLDEIISPLFPYSWQALKDAREQN